ncbi:MAG: ferritin-like domain-containing protein [Actinobacteria bacterium]|nr:ferritin-like domain-containing protein [Actinomycetota bacterium]
MSNPDPLDALQRTLAAEHAAVWGYGMVGAVLVGQQRAAARAADTAHRDQRDLLADLVRARGARPRTAEPAYEVPFPVRSAADGELLAGQLEDRTAAAWHYLVGAADTADLRRTAVAGLTAAAVRATRWRWIVTPDNPTVPFPGQ